MILHHLAELQKEAEFWEQTHASEHQSPYK
jgi:hypothetical protein